MKKEKILDVLSDVAEQLNFKVRVEKGDFAGGMCTKEEENLILLNKRHMIDKRINIIAREIAQFDLSRFDIPPAVMKIIDSERKRASEVELEMSENEDE